MTYPFVDTQLSCSADQAQSSNHVMMHDNIMNLLQQSPQLLERGLRRVLNPYHLRRLERSFPDLMEGAFLVDAHVEKRSLSEEQLDVRRCPIEVLHVLHRPRFDLHQGFLRGFCSCSDDTDSYVCDIDTGYV